MIKKQLVPEEYSEIRQSTYKESRLSFPEIVIDNKKTRGKTMKTEQKRELATKLQQWLKNEKVEEEDQTKVLSCCYGMIKGKK